MINILLAFLLFAPSVSFAQQIDYSDTISILTIYSLTSAVLVGVITSVIVLVNGRRMKGGIFGSTLTYFGVGMLIVLVGSVFMINTSLFPDYMMHSLPSIVNTIGYVVIAIAGNKLLHVTKE